MSTTVENTKCINGEKHKHLFDMDNPWTICAKCGEMRDCSTGKVMKPVKVKQVYSEKEVETLLKSQRNEIRERVEKMAVCPHCNGTGIVDCEHCEPNTHKCSDCWESGKRYSIPVDDILTLIDSISSKNK